MCNAPYASYAHICDALSGLMWPSRPDADPAPFMGGRLLSGDSSLLALLKIPSTLTIAKGFKDNFNSTLTILLRTY
jgi:hypothetical protein